MTLFPPSGLAHPSSSTTKVLKLDPIKEVKAYLNALGIIEFSFKSLSSPPAARMAT
jgi:hypothetical protein